MSGLPGKRVEANRAGMIPKMDMVKLLGEGNNSGRFFEQTINGNSAPNHFKNDKRNGMD